MVNVTYNDGGALLTLFRRVGLGFTKAQTDEETSITLTLKLWKLHFFVTFAWI